MLEFLVTLITNSGKGFQYARVAQETHEDGEPHIHALIQFENRFDTRNERFFDFQDPNRSRYYHPNIERTRDEQHVNDYIAKGGVFVEQGSLHISGTRGRKNDNELWGRILWDSNSKQEFLARVKTEQPYSYCNNFRNIEYMADRTWPEPPVTYTPHWTTITRQVTQNTNLLHRRTFRYWNGMSSITLYWALENVIFVDIVTPLF